MAWARNVDWKAYDEVPVHLQQVYLSRLGVKKKLPTKEFLDELVCTHQLVIPYENLDTIDFGRPVSLEPQRLMEKLLLNKRGGHCFELNGLFTLLLQSLGFNAWMCPCRQLRHKEGTMVPFGHCGILVYFDHEVFFCDVGYGGPVPLGALELQYHTVQVIKGKKFVVKPASCFPDGRGTLEAKTDVVVGSWIELHRYYWQDGKEQCEPVIQILPVPVLLRDFYGGNYMRTSGDGAFGSRLVYLASPTGFRSIVGNQLKIEEAGKSLCRAFSQNELCDILKEYFNLDIIGF